ncbi:hypothetical protein [Streptomyces sioyaensis]|uniref:hypothetical protein n=1 Tax=Streptomyces sioyaensis TaxID=67364 RepID=UPI0036E585FC
MKDLDSRLLALVDSVIAGDEKQLLRLTLGEARTALELLKLPSAGTGKGANPGELQCTGHLDLGQRQRGREQQLLPSASTSGLREHHRQTPWPSGPAVRVVGPSVAAGGVALHEQPPHPLRQPLALPHREFSVTMALNAPPKRQS